GGVLDRGEVAVGRGAGEVVGVVGGMGQARAGIGGPALTVPEAVALRVHRVGVPARCFGHGAMVGRVGTGFTGPGRSCLTEACARSSTSSGWSSPGSLSRWGTRSRVSCAPCSS